MTDNSDAEKEGPLERCDLVVSRSRSSSTVSSLGIPPFGFDPRHSLSGILHPFVSGSSNDTFTELAHCVGSPPRESLVDRIFNRQFSQSATNSPAASTTQRCFFTDSGDHNDIAGSCSLSDIPTTYSSSNFASSTISRGDGMSLPPPRQNLSYVELRKSRPQARTGAHVDITQSAHSPVNYGSNQITTSYQMTHSYSSRSNSTRSSVNQLSISIPKSDDGVDFMPFSSPDIGSASCSLEASVEENPINHTVYSNSTVGHFEASSAISVPSSRQRSQSVANDVCQIVGHDLQILGDTINDTLILSNFLNRASRLNRSVTIRRSSVAVTNPTISASLPNYNSPVMQSQLSTSFEETNANLPHSSSPRGHQRLAPSFPS